MIIRQAFPQAQALSRCHVFLGPHLGMGNLVAFQFTYHQVAFPLGLGLIEMPGIKFSGPHLSMGNLRVFQLTLQFGSVPLCLAPIEMPGLIFRDLIWGWRISVFFGVLLPLGSLSPRLRSHGDAVYFRSHLFGTSTGDEFQCFLVYLTLGSVPLGLGPIEMLCISGLIFFWDLIWVWGVGNQIRFSFFFFLFFPNFGMCPNW